MIDFTLDELIEHLNAQPQWWKSNYVLTIPREKCRFMTEHFKNGSTLQEFTTPKGTMYIHHRDNQTTFSRWPKT